MIEIRFWIASIFLTLVYLLIQDKQYIWAFSYMLAASFNIVVAIVAYLASNTDNSPKN